MFLWRLVQESDEKTLYCQVKWGIHWRIMRKHGWYIVRIGRQVRRHLHWKVHKRIWNFLFTLLRWSIVCRIFFVILIMWSIFLFLLFGIILFSFLLFFLVFLVLVVIVNIFCCSRLFNLSFCFYFISWRVDVNVLFCHFYQFIVVVASWIFSFFQHFL